LGPVEALSLLLPVIFYIDPTTAIIMLAGIYCGAQYGGTITSVLFNKPGESSTVVTCVDGNEMAKQGRAGPALAMNNTQSLPLDFLDSLFNTFSNQSIHAF
jgi:putative tricarboxylic transport membrane protein